MKQDEYVDPEYRRWRQKYPRFPGVAECVRLIRANKARGSWIDIIVQELATNAATIHPELIETFRTSSGERIQLFVLMALEIAALPESAPFFAEVLESNDPSFTPYALRALRAIDTSESRESLWRHSTVSGADSTEPRPR